MSPISYLSMLVFFLFVSTNASSLLLETRQSQDVSFNITVSGNTFKSFEDPATLKRYLQKQGYNYDFNYDAISKGVAQVDQYFADQASGSKKKRALTERLEPRDDSPIKTHTKSTTLKGGPSYSNATTSANATYVDAISFSNGNAATAGGAIQLGTTVSSSSSSGKANSTDTVTSVKKNPVVSILVNATTADAMNQQYVTAGKQDALTGAACAAQASGASARSSIVTRAVFHINESGNNTIQSFARSFCEAGISALQATQSKPVSGSSSSGSQASLTDGVTAVATCNGKTTKGGSPSISFSFALKGTYHYGNKRFVGTFTGSRLSFNGASCI